MCRLSWNLVAPNSWNPLGLSRPVMGLLYLYTRYTIYDRKYISLNYLIEIVLDYILDILYLYITYTTETQRGCLDWKFSMLLWTQSKLRSLELGIVGKYLSWQLSSLKICSHFLFLWCHSFRRLGTGCWVTLQKWGRALSSKIDGGVVLLFITWSGLRADNCLVAELC
jgi:hypothetical protein